MSDSFPPTFLRGIRASKHVEGGFLATDALEPPKASPSRLAKGLPAGQEMSINWEMDDGALSTTFADRSNSAFGVARLQAEQLTRVREVVGGLVWPEWDALPQNKYHGNIVYDPGLNNQRRRQIQASLALFAEFIPRPAR